MKLKLGKETFKVVDFEAHAAIFSGFVTPIEKAVRKKDIKLALKWVCEETDPPAKPFPKKFPKVSSGFLIQRLHNNPEISPRQIKRESKIDRDIFLHVTGLANGGALTAELKDKFGTYDPEFDVDTAISVFKHTMCLDITVRLRYRHFMLQSDSISNGTYIILSLPHAVTISVKPTCYCTDEGMIKIKDGSAQRMEMTRKLVRADKKEAERLRVGNMKAELKHVKARMAELDVLRKDLERDLDQLRPKDD